MIIEEKLTYVTTPTRPETIETVTPEDVVLAKSDEETSDSQ